MTVHLLNAFLSPYGGSEQETLTLYRLLHEICDVQLWGISSRLHAELSRNWPIRRASLHSLQFPRNGIFVFIGAHWQHRPWTYFARPRRLIYVFNTFHYKILPIVTAARPRLGWPQAEIVFISDFQRRQLGILGGEIHPSPIDIGRFRLGPRQGKGGLTVGRISRDYEGKFDLIDIPFFVRLAQRGVRVRLMGATCLRDERLRHPLIELLPEGAEPPENFLHTLDIFYYRTGAHVETFGRVVLEAMACGLPVVCHRRGGYADHIESGTDGFLFDTPDQAAIQIDKLLADASLRGRIGEGARRRVERVFSADAQRERTLFYTDFAVKRGSAVHLAA